MSERSGFCHWCRSTDDGGETVASSYGYWWHRDCAEENLAQLAEALPVGSPSTEQDGTDD